MAKDRQQTEEDLIKAIKDLTDEEKEQRLVDDALRRNRRGRFRGQLLQTQSEFEQADVTNRQNLGRVMAERMFRGETTGQAFTGAIKDKIFAQYKSFSKIYNPLNLLSKIPGIGAGLATAYGMKTGKSAADISYFTGAGRFLRSDRDFSGGGDSPVAERLTKIPSVENTGSQATAINSIKTPIGVLKKTHRLLEIWHKEDKKWKEELKREQQIADNFKEEQDAERHNELMRALTGKGSKMKGKFDKDKKGKEEDGFGVLDMVEGMAFYEIIKKLALRLVPALLTTAAVTSAIAAALATVGYSISNAQQKTAKRAAEGDVPGTIDAERQSQQMQSGVFTEFQDPQVMAENAREEAKRDLEAQAAKGNESAKKALENWGKPSTDPKIMEANRIENEMRRRGYHWSPLRGKWIKNDTGLFGFGLLGGEVGDPKKLVPQTATPYGVNPEGKTRAERNNNPGNLKYGEFAERYGAIGQDYGGFAIFPDLKSGEEAMRALLFKNRGKGDYSSLTLDEAITKYAPQSDNNDTSSYQQEIKQALGTHYDPNKKLIEYSREDQDTILKAMQKREGFNVNNTSSKITPMPQPNELSYRANGAINENKALTGDAAKQSGPPVIINQVNNQNIGKSSSPMVIGSSGDIRNTEPILLRSQYWNVKPV